MARLILLLGALLVGYWAYRRTRALPAAARRRAERNTLIGLAVAVPLLLALSGRLSWLAGLAVPAGLLLQRGYRLLMLALAAKRFAEQVRAEQARRAQSQGGGHAGGPAGAPGGRGRSGGSGGSSGGGRAAGGRGGLVEEAYAVLGLSRGATRADIVAAHKRLIQKVHPDKGGSDYLAAKINAARDLLLRHVRD